MTIPVSTIVRVTITTSPTFPTRAGFGTLLVVGSSDVITPSVRLKYYSGIEEVALDFATGTEEYKAANTYFSQNPKPEQIAIGRRSEIDTPASMFSGAAVGVLPEDWAVIADGDFSITMDDITADVAVDFTGTAGTAVAGTVTDPLDLTAISDAGFSITIDGVPQVLTPLDFTGVVTVDDVVVIMNGALVGAVATEDAGIISITSETVGNSSAVSLPTAPTGTGFTLDLIGFDTGTVIPGVDLGTMDEVANRIQAALQAADAGFTGATLTWQPALNGGVGAFLIISALTGLASTITYLSSSTLGGTPIQGGGFMAMTEVDAATVVQGAGVETFAEALVACELVSTDWYGFATCEIGDSLSDGIRDVEAEIVAAAEFAESRVKVFINDSSNPAILDPSDTSDIASVLQLRNFRRSFTVYNAVHIEYAAISAAARAFTVNFSQPNSTITLKFKQLPGITTASLNTTEKTAVDDKYANAYISVGSNPMFAESFMANGHFFDEIHGIDWLQNAIETNVFGKLYTTPTKVANTDNGNASLQQQVDLALDEGIRNGLGAPGFAENGTYLAKGYKSYVTPVAEMPQGSSSARQGADISFVFLGAGAIHGVEINGTYER